MTTLPRRPGCTLGTPCSPHPSIQAIVCINRQEMGESTLAKSWGYILAGQPLTSLCLAFPACKQSGTGRRLLDRWAKSPLWVSGSLILCLERLKTCSALAQANPKPRNKALSKKEPFPKGAAHATYNCISLHFMRQAKLPMLTANESWTLISRGKCFQCFSKGTL